MRAGHYFSFVTPPDVIDPSELPAGVGLYELNYNYSKCVRPLRAVIYPKAQAPDTEAHNHLIWQALCKGGPIPRPGDFRAEHHAALLRATTIPPTGT